MDIDLILFSEHFHLSDITINRPYGQTPGKAAEF